MIFLPKCFFETSYPQILTDFVKKPMLHNVSVSQSSEITDIPVCLRKRRHGVPRAGRPNEVVAGPVGAAVHHQLETGRIGRQAHRHAADEPRRQRDRDIGRTGSEAVVLGALVAPGIEDP